MQGLTDEGRRAVEAVARHHGTSEVAALHLLLALSVGGGRQAQFNHPDLGGMGQWSKGGMIMVGDMFNNALKARVDALCNDLAALLESATLIVRATPPASSQSQSQSHTGNHNLSLFVPARQANSWPAQLGTPTSTGSQNDLRYAVFPDSCRLAIVRSGIITVYDTGDHRISGFSQQQSGDQSLTFTSQYGLVRVADLKIVPISSDEAEAATPSDTAEPASSAHSPAPASTSHPLPGSSNDSDEQIFSRLERLAELHKKDVLSTEEFEAKKAELLARL